MPLPACAVPSFSTCLARNERKTRLMVRAIISKGHKMQMKLLKMCAALALASGCATHSEGRATALLDRMHPLINPHGQALARSTDKDVVETGAPLLAIACEWRGCP